MPNLLNQSFTKDKYQLFSRFQTCLESRFNDASLARTNVYRCFNGYYEGLPGLVVDRYADTLVVSNHARKPEELAEAVELYGRFITKSLPQVSSILVKTRHSADSELRKGQLVFGSSLPESIQENGIAYAVDLRLNQDDSFYPDTRNLRLWLKENSQGKTVLNCFAYTGTLGIATLFGGAYSLTQTDLNENALAVSERSYALNLFTQPMRTLPMDYFKVAAALKSQKALFDLVIIDAPFFSRTRHGKVELLNEWSRLINKARPLVAHEGYMVVINNALFTPGSQVMKEIEEMSTSGFVKFEQSIPVPADITGYPDTIVSRPSIDPAPFNHPTKISILSITRKDERTV